MTDRELMQQALEALQEPREHIFKHRRLEAITSLRERLAQPEHEPFAYAYTGIKENGEHHGPHLIWGPEYMDAMSASMGATAVPLYTAPQPEPVIDKSAARRIATALGWVPAGDTSQERVDESEKQRQEQEPVVKWDASAPLVVTPHPAFQATPPCREWVGLTEEEIKALPQWFPSHETAAVIPLIRAVEAKLREKNNG